MTDEIDALVERLQRAEAEMLLEGRSCWLAEIKDARSALSSLSTRVKELEEALRSLLGESDAGMMFSERVRKAQALLSEKPA